MVVSKFVKMWRRTALILHAFLGLLGTSFAGSCMSHALDSSPQGTCGAGAAFCAVRGWRRHAVPVSRCRNANWRHRKDSFISSRQQRVRGCFLGTRMGRESDLGQELVQEELSWYEEQLELHEDDAALLCGYARFQVACSPRVVFACGSWQTHDCRPLGSAARGVRRSQQGCKAVRNGTAQRSSPSAKNCTRTAQERVMHAGPSDFSH